MQGHNYSSDMSVLFQSVMYYDWRTLRKRGAADGGMVLLPY